MHSKFVNKFRDDDAIKSNCWIRWKRCLEKKKLITSHNSRNLCEQCNRMLKLSYDDEGSVNEESFNADLNQMNNKRLNICGPWPQVYMIDPK